MSIPFEMGERLAANAVELYAFLKFADYGHNDLVWAEGKAIVEAISRFVK